MRIDRIRAAVDRSLSAALTPADEVAASPSSAGPHTPDGTTAPEPPTESSLSPVASPRQAPQTGCAVRSRRRVVLSTNDLNKILEPGWRLS